MGKKQLRIIIEDRLDAYNKENFNPNGSETT